MHGAWEEVGVRSSICRRNDLYIIAFFSDLVSLASRADAVVPVRAAVLSFVCVISPEIEHRSPDVHGHNPGRTFFVAFHQPRML